MGQSLFRWDFLSCPPPVGRTGSAKITKKEAPPKPAKPLGAASFSVRIKRSCELRHGLKARQVPGLRKGKSNGKKGNKRKNGRQYGVQNNDDGIVLRACETGTGALRKTSGILMVHCRITHRSSSFPQAFLRWCKNTTGGHIFQEKISRLPKDCAMRQNFAARKQKSLSNLRARFPVFSWHFQHLLFESVICWTLTGLLPNFGAIVRPLPVPVSQKTTYTELASTKTTGFTTKGRLL